MPKYLETEQSSGDVFFCLEISNFTKLGVGYSPFETSLQYKDFYGYYKQLDLDSVSCIGSSLTSDVFWVVGHNLNDSTNFILAKRLIYIDVPASDP